MDEQFNIFIRPIIDAFDQVRELLRNEMISMPKIVVVGDQNAGKSSVLESLTGISLPRGENTVTRCPFSIQQRSASANEDERAEIWIDGDKAKETVPISSLAKTISRKQQELIDREAVEISDKIINLRIHRHNVPELTLYDLPGLTYKSTDLTAKIRQMIKQFTEGAETLIMLILPANADLTTSEALAICREQPDFKDRTFAVVTKIDLALFEKNILEKIKDNELGLNFAPVVIRNRTQEEMEANESHEVILEKEAALFKGHETLRNLPEASKGIGSLVKILIKFQREKLVGCKPRLVDEVGLHLKAVNCDLAKLPKAANSEEERAHRFKDCMALLGNSINEWFNCIERPGRNQNIKSVFEEKFTGFVKHIHKLSPKFLNEEYANIINEYLTNTNGLRLPNFYESKIFEKIISDEIAQIPESMFDVLDQLTKIVSETLLLKAKEAFGNYPELFKQVVAEINDSTDCQRDLVLCDLKKYLEMQKNIIYTKDYYYLDIRSKLQSQIAKFRPYAYTKNQNFTSAMIDPVNKVTETNTIGPNETRIFRINDIIVTREDIENPYLWAGTANDSFSLVVDFQISCFAYWEIFLKRLSDYLMLIIINYFISFFEKNFANSLEKKLMPLLNKKDVNIMEEGQNFTTLRLDLQSRQSELTKALQLLKHI